MKLFWNKKKQILLLAKAQILYGELYRTEKSIVELEGRVKNAEYDKGLENIDPEVMKGMVLNEYMLIEYRNIYQDLQTEILKLEK